MEGVVGGGEGEVEEGSERWGRWKWKNGNGDTFVAGGRGVIIAQMLESA